MDKIGISKKLDAAIENFQKDMFLFSKDSSEPVTQKDLYRLSMMVLNALGDVKKAFD